MKKSKIVIVIVLILLLAGVIYRGVYGATKVNGVSYNLLCTDKELTNALENHSQRYFFVDDELEKKFVKYTYNVEEITSHSLLQRFLDDLIGREYTVSYEKELLRDDFAEYLRQYNEDRSDSQDAFILLDGDEYIIEEEVQGDTVDIDAILADIDNGTVIDMGNYIINPKRRKSDLEETVELMNAYASWSVSYTNGEFLKADSSDIMLNPDYTVSVDDTFIEDDIYDVLDSFVTVGDPRMFTCTDGTQISVAGGTWGTSVNFTEEIEYVKQKFHNIESEGNRTPVFARQYEDIGGTYIEISIPMQHLWYYKDYQLAGEADVITGLPNGERNTPVGIYYISECIKGKYLVGDDYKTWVNFWMRLTNKGVGLHDAIWQHAFGGDLYYSKGSHGCINLSYDVAQWLFYESYVGMPVIIY